MELSKLAALSGMRETYRHFLKNQEAARPSEMRFEIDRLLLFLGPPNATEASSSRAFVELSKVRGSLHVKGRPRGGEWL